METIALNVPTVALAWQHGPLSTTLAYIFIAALLWDFVDKLFECWLIHC